MDGLIAPPREHPSLGLGGRSIELSLALGEPVSPDAVALAAESLHAFAQRLRAREDDIGAGELAAGRSAAAFLVHAARGVEIPEHVRHLLSEDASAITRES